MSVLLGSAYGKVELNASGVKRGAKQAKDSLSELEDVGKKLNNLFKTLAVAIAIKKVVDFSGASLTSAARVAELATINEVLARNAGLSTEAVKDEAQAVRDMGIEAAASQEVVAEFVRNNLDLAKAHDLARVAQDAATISGTNSTEATMGLIRAIVTLQPEVARIYGMTVDFNAAYQQMAASIGVTADQLTSQQKQQAALNAVIEAGVQVAGAYEAAMTKGSKVMRSFPRYINDIMVNLGTPFQASFDSAVMAIAGFLKSLGKATAEGGDLYPMLQRLAESTGVMVEHFVAFIENVDFVKLAQDIEPVLQGLIQMMTFVIDHGEIIMAILVNIGKLLLLAFTVKKVIGIVGFFKDLIGVGNQLMQKWPQVTSLFGKFAGTLSGTVTPAVLALGDALVLAGAAYAGMKIGEKLGNTLGRAAYGESYQDQSLKDALDTAKKILVISVGGWSKLFEDLGIASEGATKKVMVFTRDLLGLGAAAKTAAQDAKEAAEKMQQAAAQASNVLVDYQREETEAIRQYSASRSQIIAEANRSITDASVQYGRQLTSLSKKRDAEILKTTTDYQAVSQRSEADYQANRSRIIQNAGVEIERIERDHQERLRQLRLEHEDRVAELIDQRDALGLVKEERNYSRQIAEQERQANLQIAEKRQDVGRQLKEAALQYALERQQRFAEYQQRLKETQKQYEEEKKQLSQQHNDELSQIRRHRQQQLAELDRSFYEERRRRLQSAYQEIKELDGAMLAERYLKQQYYKMMLSDVETFMADFRRSIGSTGKVSKRASGGYATHGMYELGEKGREFVLSGATTRYMETLLGRRLSQANLIEAIRNKYVQQISTTSQQNIIQLPSGLTVRQARSLISRSSEELMGAFEIALGGA